MKLSYVLCEWRPRGGRSPCGERGLKCGRAIVIGDEAASLPVRGAWVEIPGRTEPDSGRSPSLPVRGAWVEIKREE